MVLQCIQKGNLEAARIHADDAIRKKNESLNLLKLSAKVDGIRSRLETMKATQQLAASIGNITKQLSQAEVMDVQKVSMVMDQFEKKFEDMEVASDVMDKSMNAVTANMAAQDDVDDLIRQVADEHSLELKVLLPEIGQKQAIKQAQPAQQQASAAAAQQARGKAAAN